MNTNRRKALIILCCVLGVILTALIGWTLFDRYVDRSGWVEEEGLYSYRDFHGKKITGWIDLDGNTYYFDDEFIMVTHWQTLNGNRYYFGSDGILYTGWRNVDNMRCYFGDSGILHTGWLDLNDKRYFLEDNGAMVSGWMDLEGETYYFGENGAMITGWNTLDEKIYYFDETGRLVTGRVVLDEKNYYFQDDGVLFTGWEETDQGRRYYDSDGVQLFGWQEIEGKRYYLNDEGLTQTGWHQEGEYRYYLHEDGSAAVGPLKIDGQQYYFTPKGIQVVLVNGDIKVPSYYKPELVTYTGWHQVADIALEPLKKMLDDCNSAGYEYVFNSAYRSIKTQEEILVARTQEYEDRGYSKADAYAKARETVALPGTSEHHLGLAVDVLNSAKAEKKALDWLSEHCWEYGFIIRYAEEKSHITGIIYEPWHFRYVGTAVSMDMKDSGLCLEEYLGAAAVSNSTVKAE